MCATVARTASKGLAIAAIAWAMSSEASASERSDSIERSTQGNTILVIKPDDVQSDLKSITRIAVLVSATDSLFGQMMEDLLSAKLRDRGLQIVPKTKISEETLKELRSIETDGKASEGKVKGQDGRDAVNVVDVIQIGKRLGLEAVIVGTVFEARRQQTVADKREASAIDKVVVGSFCVQVLDVKLEKVACLVMMECDLGVSPLDAIQNITQQLMKEMGKQE